MNTLGGHKRFPVYFVIGPLVFFIGVMSCEGVQSRQTPSDEPPYIVLDDAHNQAVGQVATYLVQPSDSLGLDARAYKVQVPPGVSDVPNAVHIIHGKNEYYRASWDGRGKVVLNSANLEGLKGPKRFPGFKAGEKYVIAIGLDSGSGPDHKLDFSVMWAGIVEVK